MTRNKKLYIECLILFFILPGLLFFVRKELAFRVFYLLIILTLVCTILLLRDPGFDRSILWRKIKSENLRSIAAFFFPGAMAIGLFTYFVLPSKFLAFPMARPVIWFVVMALYPLLMVLSQELVFRCFFFHRYQGLFEGKPQLLIVLNAASFGLSHLFYNNWVAPVLSFCGGLIFAWRYHTTRSFLTVSLEHAIWGNFMFTIGIGWYFYSGSIS